MNEKCLILLNVFGFLAYFSTNVCSLVGLKRHNVILTINFLNRCMLTQNVMFYIYNSLLLITSFFTLIFLSYDSDCFKEFSTTPYVRLSFIPLFLNSGLFLMGYFYDKFEITYGTVAGGLILASVSLAFWISIAFNFKQKINIAVIFISFNKIYFGYYFLHAITQLIYDEVYSGKEKAISVVFQFLLIGFLFIEWNNEFGFGFTLFFVFLIYTGILAEACSWKVKHGRYYGDCAVSGILMVISILWFLLKIPNIKDKIKLMF